MTALLAKLSDPLSARTLASRSDDARRRTPVLSSEDVVILTRDELWTLTTPGEMMSVAGYVVLSVPDTMHYADRIPGEVYTPDSGMRW